MSTHKSFNRICCIAISIAFIIAVIFLNADKIGIKAQEKVMGYETTLFDTSKVHTIDIVMDDWDSFLLTAKNKEYTNCTIVIDNKKITDVGVRAKGNSSLNMVASSDSDRYSFKIEFDHYDKNKNYNGLDKLCLNNIIQDNTYMKDYLAYTMMDEMGVASPLCSYADVSINGETFGLYLAVEALEDSFLERNYGNDSGSLYKPESAQEKMGGNKDKDKANFPQEMPDANNQNDINLPPQMPDGNDQNGDNLHQQMPQGNNQMGVNLPPQMPEGNNQNGDNLHQQMPEGNDQNGDNLHQQMPTGDKLNGNLNGRPNMMGRPGNMMNGTSDEALNYIDDNEDSYSYIFDNAVTKATGNDKDRIITALKNISNNHDIEDYIDTNEIINYFVVHNFLLNFDSYTGSIMHNYYLYENDGKLTMLPWDYNLSFNSFMTNYDTQSLVNFPIDTPVSTGTVDSRGMLSWIFKNEQYTEKYHEVFGDFISKVFEENNFEQRVDNIKEMIAPYVEKDPTKFCTFDEFESGVSTLKEFCVLRAESIKGQLNGTIGSTNDTQNNQDTLISTGNLDVKNMGSENMNKGNNNKVNNMPIGRQKIQQ